MKGSKRPFLARKSRFARRDQGEVQLAQSALTQRTEEVQHAQSAEETEFVIGHRSARMPVRPPLSRETYNFSESGHVLSHLSEEERQAAEESFSVYFRPIDLYEILQSRASEKPTFLTKCLHYKLKDKHKRRPRTGEVIFHYRYYNNTLHNTQVTEDYTCPFCYLKCASFKGLECHLLASHDLFNYEFQGEGYYQVVNVSPTAAASSSEIVGELINVKEKAFYFRSHRPTRRRKPERQNQYRVGPFMLDSNMPGASEHMDRVLYSPPAAVLPSSADIIFSGPEAASQPESSSAPTTLQRFARSRKPSNEGHPARKQSSLQTHCFDHSRTAQPMALEPVNAEEDSEDEVDEEVAGLEDRRKLDRFVDAGQHDKRMMHLWNSYKREQQVLADANLPWTCEAFSTHHREDFLQSPQLLICWKLFMVNLWNGGLIDAKTMKRCLFILNNNRD